MAWHPIVNSPMESKSPHFLRNCSPPALADSLVLILLRHRELETLGVAAEHTKQSYSVQALEHGAAHRALSRHASRCCPQGLRQTMPVEDVSAESDDVAAFVPADAADLVLRRLHLEQVLEALDAELRDGLRGHVHRAVSRGGVEHTASRVLGCISPGEGQRQSRCSARLACAGRPVDQRRRGSEGGANSLFLRLVELEMCQVLRRNRRQRPGSGGNSNSATKHKVTDEGQAEREAGQSRGMVVVAFRQRDQLHDAIVNRAAHASSAQAKGGGARRPSRSRASAATPVPPGANTEPHLDLVPQCISSLDQAVNDPSDRVLILGGILRRAALAGTRSPLPTALLLPLLRLGQQRSKLFIGAVAAFGRAVADQPCEALRINSLLTATDLPAKRLKLLLPRLLLSIEARLLGEGPHLGTRKKAAAARVQLLEDRGDEGRARNKHCGIA
mmetsp:Transcript_70779/g.229950  ORF Transcript_70779/g.229950 Transcript_70779/m.229950 type:complete len:445 (+) Transcript_70779:1863-3197(+)